LSNCLSQKGKMIVMRKLIKTRILRSPPLGGDAWGNPKPTQIGEQRQGI